MAHDKELIAFIKEIRRVSKISQEALARKLDVSYSTVNRWEKGRCTPHKAMIKKLAMLARQAGIQESVYTVSSIGTLGREWTFPTMEGQCNITLVEISNIVLEPTVFAEFLLTNLSLRESDKHGLVLDMGTGSGVVAIALAKMGCQRIHAVDLSEPAIKACERNCYANEVENKVTIIKSDLADNLRDKYDLVVANPPTLPQGFKNKNIESIDLAFFSGSQGREFFARLVGQLPTILKPSGRLVLVHPSYLDRSCLEEMLEHMGVQIKVIAFRPVQLKAFERVLGKYRYDSTKIITNMVQAYSGDQKNLIWKEGGRWIFGLEVIEAIKAV